MTQLVEVRPLKPFIVNYVCSLSECDMIDDMLQENEKGEIVKVKVPKKRAVGLIPVQRSIRPPEHDMWLKGELPPNIEVNEQGTEVVEYPAQRTLMLPADVASSLVTRGLAEVVKADKSTNKAGKASPVANAA